MCVCVGHRTLTTRFDLTADASLFLLSADPADQNVERVGKRAGFGLKVPAYLLEFGGNVLCCSSTQKFTHHFLPFYLSAFES